MYGAPWKQTQPGELSRDASVKKAGLGIGVDTEASNPNGALRLEQCFRVAPDGRGGTLGSCYLPAIGWGMVALSDGPPRFLVPNVHTPPSCHEGILQI